MMYGFGYGFARRHKHRHGGVAPEPTDIVLPAAQYDVAYSATGPTNWPDGVYDTGIGIIVTVSGGTYTASGTPT